MWATDLDSCSAGVSWWLFMGGLIDVCPWFATSYEREWLTERGFEIFDFGDRELERNDVLWMPEHTGLYIGEGMQAEALRDEHHGKGDGAAPGDQDQGETVVRPLTYGWKQVLRKPGAATSGSTEGSRVPLRRPAGAPRRHLRPAGGRQGGVPQVQGNRDSHVPPGRRRPPDSACQLGTGYVIMDIGPCTPYPLGKLEIMA